MAIATMTLQQITDSCDIFDFSYPFVRGHREHFEQLFIDHYYFHEVNSLTVDEFKHRLSVRLREVMPAYLKLYRTEHMIINPFSNYRVEESYDRKEDVDKLEKQISGAIRDTKHTELVSHKRDSQATDTSNNALNSVVNTTNETDSTSKRIQEDTSKTLDISVNNDAEHTKVIEDEDINKTVNDVGAEHLAGEVHVNGQEQVKDKHQDTTSNRKATLFSDTPQENFVLGSSNAQGNPISSYATTYTNETTDNSTEGTRDEDSTTKTDTTSKQDVNKTNNQVADTDRGLTRDTDRDRVQNGNRTIDNMSDSSIDDNAHSEGKDASEASSIESSVDLHQAAITNRTQITDKDTQASSASTQNKEDVATTESLAVVRSGYVNTGISAMLNEYRRTFINIDQQLLGEFTNLFLGVYYYA